MVKVPGNTKFPAPFLRYKKILTMKQKRYFEKVVDNYLL